MDKFTMVTIITSVITVCIMQVIVTLIKEYY